MVPMRIGWLMVLLLAGCGTTPYRMYDGEPRPRAQVGWIKPEELMVRSVDGRKVDPEAQLDRDPIEVLPGERTVRLEWTYRRNTGHVLPGYPQTNRSYRVEREGVMKRYKHYYKDVKILIKPGETYEAVWLPVEGQEEREPGLRKADR